MEETFRLPRFQLPRQWTADCRVGAGFWGQTLFFCRSSACESKK